MEMIFLVNVYSTVLIISMEILIWIYVLKSVKNLLIIMLIIRQGIVKPSVQRQLMELILLLNQDVRISVLMGHLRRRILEYAWATVELDCMVIQSLKSAMLIQWIVQKDIMLIQSVTYV